MKELRVWNETISVSSEQMASAAHLAVDFWKLIIQKDKSDVVNFLAVKMVEIQMRLNQGISMSVEDEARFTKQILDS